MGVIPAGMSDRQLLNMTEADLERLVVAPGERMCAEILQIAARWRAENEAFFAERHPGMTMDDARRRWTTDAERGAVQREYRAWRDARDRGLALAA